jgi:uncharacterized protein YuzE
MRFELDSEVNALYIYLRDGEIPAGGVARTIEVEDGINLDIDSEGFVLGMEFIDADDFPRFLERRNGRLDVPEREEDIRGLVA